MKRTKLKRQGIIVCLFTILILANFISSSEAASDYEVIPLPNPAGAHTYAWDINESGQIVGYNYIPMESVALQWNNATTFTIIADPNGWYLSSAYKINNPGIIVGYGTDPTGGSPQAIIWDTSGNHSILSKPDGWSTPGVLSINDYSNIAGRVHDPSGSPHAFYWDASGYHQLQEDGWENSWANDINNSNQMVGRVIIENYDGGGDLNHAAFWDSDGSFTDIHPQGFNDSAAKAINDNGEVLLWADDRAFVWDGNGNYREVSIGYGLDISSPANINNSGQVLLFAFYEPGNQRLFVVDNDGSYKTLPIPEGSMGDSWGEGFNDSGMVVGQSHFDLNGDGKPDEIRAFLWVPTLEATIDDIIEYINDHADIVGVGPGNSADNKYNAFLNMLQTAGELIEAGDNERACDQLNSIIKKCDGPPDFINGNATTMGTLIGMLDDLMESLECE